MAYEPNYCDPKKPGLRNFFIPKVVVESGESGLIVQENKIYPSYPVFVDYQFYNWEWTNNEDIANPNKWLWMDDDNEPIAGSSAVQSPAAGYLEKYAPIRIWMKGSADINIGVARERSTRDGSQFLEYRLRDLTPYSMDRTIDLGRISSDREPRNTEFYMEGNTIYTNFDFGNDPTAASNLIMVYETLTTGVKVRVDLRTNENGESDYTPYVDKYNLYMAGR